MYTSALPLKALQKQQTPISRKNIYIYSTISEATSDQDPNLAACAHLYHSDRESVWSILRQYELLDVLDSAASLSHTVIFHGGAEQLKFHNASGRRWFFLESWSKRVSDGRGLHEGRIYDREGNHVASTMQDGAIRLSFGSEDEKKTREEQIRRRSNL
jgi:acyl-CoA thioesterase II